MQFSPIFVDAQQPISRMDRFSWYQKPPMPTPRRTLKPDRRRALELLADCPQEGCTEAVMLANGVTIEQMVELVRAGLASGDYPASWAITRSRQRR
jgi:hypothetical protein